MTVDEERDVQRTETMVYLAMSRLMVHSGSDNVQTGAYGHRKSNIVRLLSGGHARRRSGRLPAERRW